MAIVPLYGHAELRARLRDMVSRGALPSTLLFQGARGVGKQRLALWLAQYLVCEQPQDEPCGECKQCRFAVELRHPDIHWVFPHQRPKNTDPDLADVRADQQEAVAERAAQNGLYEPPSGLDGIFVTDIRAVVQQAALSPSIATRKVFVIGDADRMVSQEGSDQAANAFLKLLEEPAPDTTIVLTSSEAGALLATVRSRAVSLRVPPLSQDDMRAFLADEKVVARLSESDDVPDTVAEQVVSAGGAPGRLLAGAAWSAAREQARRLMEAIAAGASRERYEGAWAQTSSRARGSYADTLDALTEELHDRARRAARNGAEREALAASKAVELVEAAKEQVIHNVSPQLLTVNLIRDIQELFA